MENMVRVTPEELNLNIFQSIGKDWMAVCAKHGEETNAMTASWGGFGILWNKPVAYVFLRPQRYTKKLVDQAGMLTLNFFQGKQKEALTYLGKTTATETPDKMAHCGLTTAELGNTGCFKEADIVMVVKSLYRQTMDPACFLDQQLIEQNYPQKDFHDLYVCEIIDVYIK